MSFEELQTCFVAGVLGFSLTWLLLVLRPWDTSPGHGTNRGGPL